jgi:hypothetical protein
MRELAYVWGVIGLATAAVPAERQPVHTSEQFAFVANAPLVEIFPLLGADKERLWAPGWDPRFVWPAVASDQVGMVFRITRGEKVATWVNTVFDREAGRVQYVYVLSDVVATVITLQLHARAATTEVSVRYERTSLSPESDTLVKEMAEQDRDAGPVWASQINTYLAQAAGRATEPSR